MTDDQERVIARGIQKHERAVDAGKVFAGIAWLLLAVPIIWAETSSGWMIVPDGAVLATFFGLMVPATILGLFVQQRLLNA